MCWRFGESLQHVSASVCCVCINYCGILAGKRNTSNNLPLRGTPLTSHYSTRGNNEWFSEDRSKNDSRKIKSNHIEMPAVPRLLLNEQHVQTFSFSQLKSYIVLASRTRLGNLLETAHCACAQSRCSDWMAIKWGHVRWHQAMLPTQDTKQKQQHHVGKWFSAFYGAVISIWGEGWRPHPWENPPISDNPVKWWPILIFISK